MLEKLRDPRWTKIYIPTFLFAFYFLVVGTLGLVYLLRPPLLIVTDLSFSMLYGPQRLRERAIRTSWELFRRVEPVFVNEGAGASLIALAVEASSRRPWAVIFPHRYLTGARVFQENNSDVPVLVLGGPRPYGETALRFARTNTALDLYRAGLSAAKFAGEGNVLFFSDGVLQEELRTVFTNGLRAQGFTKDPIFVNAAFGFPSFDDIGCVVVAAPVSGFFEQGLDIPVILFSWTNPDFTPSAVKLVFDDSCWALASRAARALPRQEEDFLISSSVQIIRYRIDERSDFRQLRSLIREILPKN